MLYAIVVNIALPEARQTLRFSDGSRLGVPPAGAPPAGGTPSYGVTASRPYEQPAATPCSYS